MGKAPGLERGTLETKAETKMPAGVSAEALRPEDRGMPPLNGDREFHSQENASHSGGQIKTFS